MMNPALTEVVLVPPAPDATTVLFTDTGWIVIHENSFQYERK